MNTESENGQDKLTDETRANLQNLSKAMLILHKTLLDIAKAEYEAQNGTIASVNQYFQLVIEDPHFAWLRKISSLIALIDEAVSVRRPATEDEAKALENQAELLLTFKDNDFTFNLNFQNALDNNLNAIEVYNDALRYLLNEQ